jgi:alpha-beta hydrolase superfamily lysophospholipase
LWVHDRQPRVAALVLNSPWLDLQGSLLLRTAGTKAIDQIGARRPYLAIPRDVSGFYARSLHRDHDGEWDFDLAWKPLESWPVYAGWLRAVRRGHARAHRGLELTVPVLVLTSSESGHPKEYDETCSSTDIVLDVELIRKWAHKLAGHVTLVRVEGAVHDVTMSRAPVRERVFAEISRWLDAYVG